MPAFRCACDAPKDASGPRPYVVHSAVGPVLTCSNACARRTRRDLRQRARPLVRCLACRQSFRPSRSDARYCGGACRQRACRARRAPDRSRPRARRTPTASTGDVPPAARPRARGGEHSGSGDRSRRRQGYGAPDQRLGGARGDRALRILAHHARPGALLLRPFFGEHLGGAVVYAAEPGEKLGVWDSYGFTGKIITLARGASLPWAPANTGSKLVRRSMRLLPGRFKIVTATADPTAGERGVIYRASGFHYVGVLAKGGRVLIRRHDGGVISGGRRGANLARRGSRPCGRSGLTPCRCRVGSATSPFAAHAPSASGCAKPSHSE